MSVRQLCQELGLDFIRQEGQELVHHCYECGGRKLYINSQSGVCQCFNCGNKGNGYTLIEDITGKGGKEAMDLLAKHQLADINPMPTKKKVLQLKPTDVCSLSIDEKKRLCSSKKIYLAALDIMTPFKIKNTNIAIIPAFNPAELLKYPSSKACGWIRVGIDGQLIDIKIKDENGNWTTKQEKYPVVSGSYPGLLGIKRIIVNNPETIMLCEGWRDALAAMQLGYYATANSQGAKTWRDDWNILFKDKNVYIIYDQDQAGYDGARKAAKALKAVAKTVKIATLPYELQKAKGKDLHDYIVADGHTKEDLELLLQGAEDFVEERIDNQQLYPVPNDHADTVAACFEDWSRRNGVMHRYNKIDGWSIYKDNKYQQVDASDIEKYLRGFISDVVVFGNEKDGFKIPNNKHKSKAYIDNAIIWLRDSDNVHLLPSQKAPCALSSELKNKKIIPVQNGLVDATDCNNISLLESTPDYYTFNYLPFNYDTNAKAPTWQRAIDYYFQNETVDIDGNITTSPDEFVPDILHSWIKKYLFRDTSHQRILAIIGHKRSGKSTIARVIRALIGMSNTATITVAGLSGEFGLQPLINKQLAIMWDANVSGKNSDINKVVELLKSISGEDGISINRKNKSILDVEKLPLSILIVANKVNDLRDSTTALASRFTFLQTTITYAGSEDPNIEKCIMAELPGILNLVLKAPEGQVLEHPKSEALRAEFEEMSSPYKAFINDWCEIDSDAFVPTDFMWAAYCDWCQENGHSAPSKQKFKIEFSGTHHAIKKDYRPRLSGDVLDQFLYEYNYGQTRTKNVDIKGRAYCYRGIDLKEDIKVKIRLECGLDGSK